MRCFLHVCNLVAKSILCLFDGSCGKDSNQIQQLIESADLEERQTADHEARNGDAEVSDNNDGLIDSMEGVDEESQKDMMEKLLPVREVLIKVINKIKKSAHQFNCNIICSCAKLPLQLSTPQPFWLLLGHKKLLHQVYQRE